MPHATRVSNASLPAFAFTSLALLASGCLTVRATPRVDFTEAPSAAAPLPAVPPEQVGVYEYDPRKMDEWPEGITVHIGPVATAVQRLDLAPDYPTSGSPHRLVGAVSTRYRGLNMSNQAARQLLAAEAGKRGANGVFVIKDDHTGLHGVAVWVSPATPARNHPSASDALAAAARGLDREFTPEGPSVSTQLEALRPLALPGKRGRCYAVAFALDTDADLSRQARKGLGWAFNSPDGDIQANQPSVSPNPAELLNLRSSATRVGCPQVDGPLEMNLRATSSSGRTDAKLRGLGKGRVVLQAYSMPVSEEELKKRKETSRRLWREAEEANKAYAKEKCFECKHLLASCNESSIHDCDEYSRCLSRHAVRVEHCQ